MEHKRVMELLKATAASSIEEAIAGSETMREVIDFNVELMMLVEFANATPKLVYGEVVPMVDEHGNMTLQLDLSELYAEFRDWRVKEAIGNAMAIIQSAGESLGTKQ